MIERKRYYVVNLLFLVVFLVLAMLGLNRNNSNYLLFRVLERAVLGILLIGNGGYMLLTDKWTVFKTSSNKQRKLFGILITICGLLGLITAIMGYGTNGDPRLIWWK